MFLICYFIVYQINNTYIRCIITNVTVMDNSFNQNRVWGWGELALQYFPNISQKSATMQLLKWVRVSDTLVTKLEHSGWHPGKKYLTPRQKDYIVEHLGEP